jgi:hypothetical protein
MGNLYRESSIDASYKVSVHFANQFQRRIFLEINQPETRIAYGGHATIMSRCSVACLLSSPCQRKNELLASVGHLSSVNFSHLNLLL